MRAWHVYYLQNSHASDMSPTCCSRRSRRTNVTAQPTGGIGQTRSGFVRQDPAPLQFGGGGCRATGSRRHQRGGLASGGGTRRWPWRRRLGRRGRHLGGGQSGLGGGESRPAWHRRRLRDRGAPGRWFRRWTRGPTRPCGRRPRSWWPAGQSASRRPLRPIPLLGGSRHVKRRRRWRERRHRREQYADHPEPAEQRAAGLCDAGSEEGTIEAMLHKIDILPLQVRIDATIAEVTLNDNAAATARSSSSSPAT